MIVNGQKLVSSRNLARFPGWTVYEAVDKQAVPAAPVNCFLYTPEGCTSFGQGPLVVVACQYMKPILWKDPQT